MDSTVGDCGFSSQYLSDDFIARVVEWLRNLTLRDVCQQQEMTSCQTISKAVDEILQNATRQTYQQAKALKQRAQVEAIASQCLRYMHGGSAECDIVLELGAGQGMLGHAVSLASNLPLVAVDRRSNTDALALASVSTVRVQAEIAAFTTSLSLPERNRGSSIGGSRPAVVVKHLCGHGFDEALTLALVLHRESRFGLFCGAPCCHATMRWASLSPEVCQWLREIGMPGTHGTPDEAAKAFSLLTDIIRLSRVGAGSKACGRWRLRHHVDDTEAALLGRKVCRLIDEGRLVHLESQGLTVRLLEYCHPSLSPDNVLVLAKPQDFVDGAELPLPWPEPGAGSLPPPLPPLCILIELDPTAAHSLTFRVAAVLMEMKASRSLPITVAGVADSTHVLACSVLGTDPSVLTDLLQCLGHSLLLQRVVSRYMPLTSTATQLSDVVRAAQSGRELGLPTAAQLTLRVSARPRSVEPDLCKALPSQVLDPVHFTHVLTLYHGYDFRYSLLPRSCFDPSAWSDSKREAHKESKVAFRFVEAGLRCRRLWKSDAVSAVTGVVIWSDTKEAKADEQWIRFASKVWGSEIALAELRPACSSGRSGWAAKVETCSDICLVPCRGTWYSLEDGRQGGASGNLLLLDASSTNEEAILLVRRILQTVLRAPSPALDRCGTAVLRLRCGRRPRAVKQWLKDMTHLIEETSKFNRVELLHLLSDRENERTAVFSWSGIPTETETCGDVQPCERPERKALLKAHLPVETGQANYAQERAALSERIRDGQGKPLPPQSVWTSPAYKYVEGRRCPTSRHVGRVTGSLVD